MSPTTECTSTTRGAAPVLVALQEAAAGVALKFVSAFALLPLRQRHELDLGRAALATL
jgi:hypothetical protein